MDVLIFSQELNIERYWPSEKGTEATDGVEDAEYALILIFYQSLLDHFTEDHYMLDKYFRQSHVQHAVARLAEGYGQRDSSRTLPEPNYNRFVNCLGYLQMFAPCHAAVAYNAMYRIFQSNSPTVIRRMLSTKDELGIVCLGSGPGCDLLGLLGALYGKHYGLLKLDITASDKMAGWKEIFTETQRRLRDDDWGNASKLLKEVDVVDCFMAADLALPLTWTDDFKQKLYSADLIILSYLLSVVSNVQKMIILERIVGAMKYGSVLIFIDCLFPSVEFDVFQDYLELIYDATIEKFRYDYEVERFGFNNITSSSAYIRVFERKQFVKEEENCFY